MTKEEFIERVNEGRYPKYVLSQIKEGEPSENCSAIVCTLSNKILLAKYENGKWSQACFTTPGGYTSQRIYYIDINEDIRYWTEGEATEGEATEALAQKPSEDLEKAADNCYYNQHAYARESFIEGANWHKEQLLKNAMDGQVNILPGGFVSIREINNYALKQYLLDNFKTGDKIKIIIINK